VPIFSVTFFVDEGFRMRTGQRIGQVSFLCLLTAVLVGVVTHLVAQQKVAPAFTDADWPRYAGDLAAAKYSKLTQISSSNVSMLVPAWTFQGVGTHARFRAIDSKTGKELSVTRLNATGSASPITYQAKNGRQYVVQAAAGTINVFTLP
jgi:glucose dehydrogenase